MATYDPNQSPPRAHRVEILRDTGLDPLTVRQLAQSANYGEAEGRATQVNLDARPGFLTLELDDGNTLPLRVVPGAGYVTGLESYRGTQVSVRYDPYDFNLLYIQRRQPSTGEIPVSGVILSLDLKESREIDIAQPGGNVLTVTWVSNTELERDSLPINPGDISVGDIVRPTSRYVPTDVTLLTLRRLVLISPVANIDGPVVGVDPVAGLITVLPDDGDLVTVHVNPATRILQDGQAATLGSLQPGNRLGVGSLYDPLTFVASRIVIEPPKVVRISGSIVALDQQDYVITVQPDGGRDRLRLLVPNKPRIITVDGDSTAIFPDLRVNYRVDNLLYRYDDEVVVQLNASSR